MAVASSGMKDLSGVRAGLMAGPGYLMNGCLETVERRND